MPFDINQIRKIKKEAECKLEIMKRQNCVSQVSAKFADMFRENREEIEDKLFESVKNCIESHLSMIKFTVGLFVIDPPHGDTSSSVREILIKFEDETILNSNTYLEFSIYRPVFSSEETKELLNNLFKQISDFFKSLQLPSMTGSYIERRKSDVIECQMDLKDL